MVNGSHKSRQWSVILSLLGYKNNPPLYSSSTITTSQFISKGKIAENIGCRKIAIAPTEICVPSNYIRKWIMVPILIALVNPSVRVSSEMEYSIKDCSADCRRYLEWWSAFKERTHHLLFPQVVVQTCQKRRRVGCVNSPPWPEEARTRDHAT